MQNSAKSHHSVYHTNHIREHEPCLDTLNSRIILEYCPAADVQYNAPQILLQGQVACVEDSKPQLTSEKNYA